MARRTDNLPDGIEDLAQQSSREGESFSATVSRRIAARAEGGLGPPRYVSSGEGPDDLGRAAEQYLRELVQTR